jgi:Lsr2
MRITIDTREDSYEDALGVLRRAYGWHRLARTTEEPPAVPSAVDLSNGGAVPGEADDRSTSGAGRKDARLRKGRPMKGDRKAAAKRASATRAAAMGSPGPKPTGKRASVKKAARSAPGHGRAGAPRKHAPAGVAANTAPRGQSEAVRAWAKEQGMQVRARGRMPAQVIAAYLEAHSD